MINHRHVVLRYHHLHHRVVIPATPAYRTRGCQLSSLIGRLVKTYVLPIYAAWTDVCSELKEQIWKEVSDAVIIARESDKSMVESDIDNDAVAKVFGRDGKGRVLGLGMGVSKTTIQYSTAYKSLEEEHEANKHLQTEVKRLKVEINEIKQVLSQNRMQHSSTCYGSSSQAQEGSRVRRYARTRTTRTRTTLHMQDRVRAGCFRT